MLYKDFYVELLTISEKYMTTAMLFMVLGTSVQIPILICIHSRHNSGILQLGGNIWLVNLSSSTEGPQGMCTEKWIILF